MTDGRSGEAPEPRRDPERMRELSALAAKARAEREARRLTLPKVEAQLGELATLEDAMRWLRQIGLWCAAGMLAGSVASACNRSVEVWVRAHESRLTREVVDQLRKRLGELEQQVQARPLGVVR